MAGNFERMLELVNEIFDTRNDPDQLDITEDVREKLQLLDSVAMTEVTNENGPILWMIIIPTTYATMKKFIAGSISEMELFDETQPGVVYEAIYLCSVLVLPEFRRKGIAKDAAIAAISKICLKHPIKSLFVWSFSKEGQLFAESIAKHFSLPLYEKAYDR